MRLGVRGRVGGFQTGRDGVDHAVLAVAGEAGDALDEAPEAGEMGGIGLPAGGWIAGRSIRNMGGIVGLGRGCSSWGDYRREWGEGQVGEERVFDGIA